MLYRLPRMLTGAILMGVMLISAMLISAMLASGLLTSALAADDTPEAFIKRLSGDVIDAI